MATRRRKRGRPSGEADPLDVASFAAGLRKTHLLCRELGHNWLPFTVRLADGGGYDRVLRCSRCRTERWQLLTAFGGIVSNQYKYPEGYTNQGHGRIVGEGRDMLRLESVTRLLGEANG
jgi:hypothetical protein